MRIELKDENQEEIQPMRRDRLEDKYESDLTPKEKRLLEKQKLKGMGFKKKLEYIWMYYKPAIFGFLAVILAIFVGMDIYHNAQIEEVFSMFVVNGAATDDGAVVEDIRQLLGLESDLEEVNVSTSLQTEATQDNLDYNSSMLFIVRAQTGEMDVLIMPEGLYQTFLKQEYFEDLHGILGEEGYAAMGEMADGTCLKVSAELLAEKKILVPYEEAYVAVLVTAKNRENAAKWLLSLAE